MTSDEELRAWLREAVGLHEFRRVVRENDETVVISKFESGFSQELFATVEALPELFDDEVVGAEYRRLASRYAVLGEAPPRTRVWREASEALLRRLGAERGLTQEAIGHVVPGIESVQAVLDTIFWRTATTADAGGVSVAEREAYEELMTTGAAEDAGLVRDIFTRYYGQLGDKRVENYCPGSQFARRFLAQAFRICGQEP